MEVRDYEFAPGRMIRIMSDYGSTPLWAEGCIDTDSVGLSADLVTRLDAWQQLFDEHFHWERGWDTADAATQYTAEGHALLELVSAQLPGYIVELHLWPTEGGTHSAGGWIPGWQPCCDDNTAD